MKALPTLALIFLTGTLSVSTMAYVKNTKTVTLKWEKTLNSLSGCMRTTITNNNSRGCPKEALTLISNTKPYKGIYKVNYKTYKLDV